MDKVEHLQVIVPGAAFALAFVFGAVANRVNFCTMGAISDVVNIGDWRRMRMWLLAIAVAIAGATALEAAGLVDLSKTIYTGPRVPWLSCLVGGVTFGFGMTLASGCGSKNLVRLGAGNLRSLVVLIVLGMSAYMSLKGLFAVWRINALDALRLDTGAIGSPRSDLGSVLGALAGRGAGLRAAASLAVAAALAGFVFASARLRADPAKIAGGATLGALIVAGWYLTGHVGYVPEHPQTLEEAFVATNSGRAESFSFVAPAAYLLELLMFWSDQSKIVTFGIAAVLGVIAGSAAVAILSGRFRWEGFASLEDLVMHLVGAALMGFGGVTALGCTVGQGLSGISTLAIGSVIAFASIVGGCVAALKFLYWREETQTMGAVSEGSSTA